MEARDGERVVIARPVASRPSCSSLNSFSGLLSGAISTSTPVATPIRPKTVRIKSEAINRASEANVSSKGKFSGTPCCFSPERGSNPVYKPLAKLVSSKTVQLLANMDNLDIRHLHAVQSGHSDQHIQTQVPSRSKLYQKPPSQPKTSQTNEPSHAASQNLEESQRAQLSTSGDRSSFDGYNWRKYGQKQVKGSEYPRSYYKCTHPSCPVKKKVERSLDGHIAEIVYKGEHSHSKPQPPKRHSSGLQEHGVVSDVSGQETGNPSWSTTREGSERRIENKNESKLAVNLSYSGVGTNPYDSVIFGAFSSVAGVSGDCEEGSRGGYAEHDEPKVKRRKNDHQFSEVGILGQGGQDPRVLVQSSTDSEVLVDGFRWRKYGQKVVKGNSYPRGYYRCTSIKCNVRKHVERAVDDPRAFITTYEGKHNHEMPSLGNLNPGTSDPDSAAHSNKSKL